MTQIDTSTAFQADVPTGDVFAAARWFHELANCTAKAVSPDEIEWQSNVWVSHAGYGGWSDSARLPIVAAALHLESWDCADTDDLVVLVPLARVAQAADLIDRLGDSPEKWTWVYDDGVDRQIAEAAETLAIPAAEIAGNADLLFALRIR